MFVDNYNVCPKRAGDTNGKLAIATIQVQGPATIYIGKSQTEVSLSTTDASKLKGFTYTQADGVVQLRWNGEVWIGASAGVDVAFDISDITS